jgi:hypothetical protein
MKNLAPALVVLFLISFGIYHLTNSLSFLNKRNKEMQLNIGKKIIIEDDTLIVIDYSFFNDSYTLSNGICVNKSIVEK